MTSRALFYLVHGHRPGRVRRRATGRKGGPARSWKYRAWIRTLPSLVSGRMGCEACHTRNNGLQSKGSCFSCVPLTRAEHREYDAGRVAFEVKHGVTMADVVRELNRIWKLGKDQAA